MFQVLYILEEMVKGKGWDWAGTGHRHAGTLGSEPVPCSEPSMVVAEGLRSMTPGW